ncbi:hypothetical protein FEI61_22485, partial [Shigella flexneri]|nr:hypothetical protein [Escherichia coli]EFW8162130.1 hypothetical protein [Shigella flexneri]
MNFCSQKEQPAAVKCRVAENEPGNLFFISVRRNIVSQRPDNKAPECICGKLISGSEGIHFLFLCQLGPA